MTIGLTMGDPAGVGPEVLVKAVKKLLKSKPSMRYLIIGDRRVLENYCAKLKIKNFFGNSHIRLSDLGNVSTRSFRVGKDRPEYGRASLEYLDEAISLLKDNKISALVTSPVSKAAINSVGIAFPGHTEYLASSFGTRNFIMMMVSRNMRVVPLTRHIALREVPWKINYRLVYDGIAMTAFFLKKYFSISHPRIAVCALNPHSGEAGFMGREEKRIIAPAIKNLNKNISARICGPFSADGLFAHYRRKQFDCIIGMYHDQALIPAKLSDCHKVVNLTLGLPFIRTSPAHGTAFDIAGKGIASPDSMVEAIKLAYRLSRNALYRRVN